MFGYVKKDRVIALLEQGIKDLYKREQDMILDESQLGSTKEMLDYMEAINKLRGGQHCIGLLINKIKEL